MPARRGQCRPHRQDRRDRDADGALTSQLELMTQQLGALEARIGGGGAPQQLAPPQAEEPETPVALPPSGDEPLPELPGR
jgi:hypothetical protein